MDVVLNSPDGKVPVPEAKPEVRTPQAPQREPRSERGPEIPPGRLEPTPA
jgi:hypothetical protein